MSAEESYVELQRKLGDVLPDAEIYLKAEVAAEVMRLKVERGFAADVAWLADDARGGRGVGSPGLEESRAYIERRFKDLGLDPVGPESFSLPFSFTTGVEVEAATSIKLDGKVVERAQFEPAPYSASATVSAGQSSSTIFAQSPSESPVLSTIDRGREAGHSLARTDRMAARSSSCSSVNARCTQRS